MDCSLIPGLPTDLAMLCLAKLPIDAVARGRTVSRAFAAALRQYPPGGRLPQGLAAFCKGEENYQTMSWFFLSRHSDLRSLVVPFFFLKGRNDEACRNTSRLQVIGTGTPLMLVRSRLQFTDHHMPSIWEALDGYLAQGPGCLQGFDVWQMKWLNPRATPWGRMPVDRWDFATAHCGKHVYFAGGEGPRGAASSAERLSLDTWTWETLPPMYRERSSQPSAFAIGGRFVVVGGESDSLRGPSFHSGEFYDPTTNTWTLVPEMWPPDLWWDFGWPQSVAVVKDVAYAIHSSWQVLVELRMDSPSFTNVTWHGVARLPVPSGLEKGFPVARLLSVQDELWAVLDYIDLMHSEVFSCKPPLPNEGLRWERVYTVAHSTRSTLTVGAAVST